MTEDKTLYVLEVPVCHIEDNFETAKEQFKNLDTLEIIKKAQNSECDVLCLTFNIKSTDELSKAEIILTNLLPYITKPLMIKGSGNDNIDKILLPKLSKNVKKESIIASANENTYKEIIPEIIRAGHKLILKTPIDINLCKELNILSADMGLPLNKIILDTDIGGLGYGLDYGYSTIEKIKLENDEYLNMPIISFVAEESLKTKETKTNKFSSSWGEQKARTKFFELASVAAVKAAGADIIVMYHSENIKIMKGLE